MKEKIFKKGIVRRLFSVVLIVAMVIMLTSMTSITVMASDSTQNVGGYDIIVPEGANLGGANAGTTVKAFPTSPTSTGPDKLALAGGWYVVNGNVTIGSSFDDVYTYDSINLILNGNLTINAYNGFDIKESGSLTVWSTSATNKLTITDGRYGVISGAAGDRPFVINGGEVKVSASADWESVCGTTTTVNGGKLVVEKTSEDEDDTVPALSRLIVNDGEVKISGNYAAESKNLSINGGTVEFIGSKQAITQNWEVNNLKIGTDVVVRTGVSAASTTKVTLGSGETWLSKLAPATSGPKYIKISPKHSHTWDYAADGETLTATCTCKEGDKGYDDCEYKEIDAGADGRKVSLTLTASDANYSGSPVSADFGSGEKTAWDTTVGTGKISSIKYAKKNSDGTYETETEAAPTDVGTYKASVTATDDASKTASVEFTISPKTITSIDVTLTPKTHIYDNTEKSVTVSVSGLTENTHYTVSGTTQATDLSTGQGYAVTVTGIGNYTGTVTKYWTITKEPITITTPPTASAIEYGQSLSSSTLTGGDPDSSSGTWSWVEPDTQPSVSDSNTTDYQVKFTPNNTISGPNTTTVKLTVTKSTPTAPNATAVAPTSATATDGKITGVNDTMEYAVYDADNSAYGSYANVSGTEITGLAAGAKVKVRVKASDNNYEGAEKEFTVPAYSAPSRPSYPTGGGGSSSTSGTTPTTPSGGTIGGTENSGTNISVNTSNGNATVSNIPANTVNNIANNTAEKAIVIDVSKSGNNGNDVTKVTIPKETVETIAAALNSSNNNKESLIINTNTAAIKIDSTALASIADQAKAGNIQLVVENKAEAKLNNSQKSAVDNLNKSTGKDVVQTFEAYFVSGGTRISSFGGGEISIGKLDFDIPAGKNAKNYHVYYISEAGVAERYPTWVENGSVYFRTTHLSDYAIVYDETLTNDQGKEVYRLWNPKNGDHLLTTNKAEKDACEKNGWRYEGVAFIASEEGKKVYRLYNPRSGEHFYTTSEAEKNACVAGGWRLEGTAFTTDGTKEVYRLYGGGMHLFTTSAGERDNLIKHGWKLEGVGFKAN